MPFQSYPSGVTVQPSGDRVNPIELALVSAEIDGDILRLIWQRRYSE